MKKLLLILIFLAISNTVYANGKTCLVKGDNWKEKVSQRSNGDHEMNMGLCSQYYNSEILNFIVSRLK